MSTGGPLTNTDSSAADVAEWMADALSRQAAGKGRTIDGHLVAVGDAIELECCLATTRCHFVARTPQGEILVERLARKLATQIVEYCIPESRIAEARDAGSTEAVLGLQREAQDLFAKVEHSGESGELLLYLLLETVLGLPQLLCKMPLKTNPNVHVHGSDGVHGTVLPNGNLALYWGESKLHASYTKAIDECFASLAPFLTGGLEGRAHRDLLLMRDRLDLDDPALESALKRYLLEDTPESTCVEFRGASLIGFDVADYPDPNAFSEDASKLTARWLARVHEQIHARDLTSFQLEVFCVPFPSVDSFRSVMRDALHLR